MGIQPTKIDPKDSLEPLILVIKIERKLMEGDYEILVPEIEVPTRQSKMRIFVELVDFYGWSTCVLWKDTKFAERQFSHVERIAIVGDKYWARGMGGFCRPFSEASWRYYDLAIIEEGRKWIYQKEEKNSLRQSNPPTF